MAEEARAWVCPRCDGSGELPEYWYYEEGVCFACNGSGLLWSGTNWFDDSIQWSSLPVQKRGIEPTWFTHPALLYYFGKSFRNATRGRRLPSIEGNREGVSGSIISEPIPPEVARQVFDNLTNRTGKVTNGPSGSRVFSHGFQETVWQIHLLTGSVGGSPQFSQLQLVFSREWEPTAKALVKTYLGLFAAVDPGHQGIRRIRGVSHKDSEILDPEDSWKSPIQHDDELPEESVDDLYPEGLEVGRVRFSDADSEYR